MARIQTRRAISINRDLYDRLMAHARAVGIPAAQLTECGIQAVLKGWISAAALHVGREYRDGHWRPARKQP